MHAPRWYSSVAALANGEMLTFGGSYTPNPSGEVFQFDQSWRPLNLTTPFAFDGDYQWLQATPEGNVISFGPQNLVATIETQEGGEWNTLSARDDINLRDYGSYAMFDVGKILVAGGGNSVATSVVIDTATGQSSSSGDLNIGRRQHNLTILADGSVLATGGNTDGTRYVSLAAPAFEPELWDSASGQWRLLNPGQRDRQYHSIALLLPDATVLVAGGGICGDCYRVGYEERNAEIFTPPYLYNSSNALAARPPLSGVPAMADYAQTIQVNVGNTASITKAHLIKLGSTTHSENQDQRLVPLSLSGSGGLLDLMMPRSRDVAPPGHYMLFVVNQQGVPSQGEIVKLGMPLIEGSNRIINTLELGAADNYRIAAQAGTTNLTLTAASGVKLQVRADAANAANLCAVSSSAVQQCQFASAVAGDWIVTIDGNLRSDYQLEVAFDGQAIPVTETPVTTNVPVTVTDTVVDGVTTDDTSEGANSVVVGGGSIGVSHLFMLFMVIAGKRLRRAYCYNACSLAAKQLTRECV